MSGTSRWSSLASDISGIRRDGRAALSNVGGHVRSRLRHLVLAYRAHPWTYCFVAVCTVAAIVLDSYHLGSPSIWGDEGDSISIASQHGTALLRAMAHDGGNFAFYYFVLHILISVFGTGTATLRFFSVFCAGACVPLAYALATLLVGRRCGVMSAALTVVTLPLIYWAQQIRGYTLVTALVTGSAIALVIALRDGGWRAFAWFGVLSVLSCYTELLAGLVIMVQFVVLALTPAIRAYWRRWAVTGILIVIGLVPLVFMAKARGSRQLFWLGPPKPKQMREVVGFLASARVAGIVTPSSNLLIELTKLLVFLAIAVALLRSLYRWRLYPLRVALLGGLWLVVPVSFAYSFSIHITPIFLDRYFVLCLPALTLLMAYALSALPFATIGWIGCGVIIGLRAQQVGLTYNFPIDNWRAATTAVVDASRSGDCVAFYFNDGFVDFAYYLEHPPAGMRHPAPLLHSVLPALSFGAPGHPTGIGSYRAIVESYQSLSLTQIRQTTKSCPELFLISNHDGHNSATSGAREVWARLVRMRQGFEGAYGALEQVNLGSIVIYRFSHVH